MEAYIVSLSNSLNATSAWSSSTPLISMRNSFPLGTTKANGLTARLSVQIVNEANKFKSDCTIKVLDEEADLKSIMNVMALVKMLQ